MKKTNERITVYQYKKSKRTIGIVKFGRGFFIFNVDLKTKSLSSLKYQKYFKRDSLHPTSYVVDVLKIIDGDSIRIEDPIFLEKSDLELDKWTHPTPLPDLPVRHFKELSKEELHWAGKRDGNVADRAFGYLITLALIIIAITTYHDLAILAAVIAVIAILTSNPVTGWKCSTKPDESLLHEIKEYKASLSHNDYVSKNFLDDTLKDFNNWKKLSPYQFEIAVTKLLNQQNYKVEVTQASNDGGVIPPLLASAKSRGFLGYSNCLGGTPPIAECGRTLL